MKKRHANYTEYHPFFYLVDYLRDENGFESEDDVEVSLTDEQIKNYDETMRKFFEWQQMIRDMAFVHMGLDDDPRED